MGSSFFGCEAHMAVTSKRSYPHPLRSRSRVGQFVVPNVLRIARWFSGMGVRVPCLGRVGIVLVKAYVRCGLLNRFVWKEPGVDLRVVI